MLSGLSGWQRPHPMASLGLAAIQRRRILPPDGKEGAHSAPDPYPGVEQFAQDIVHFVGMMPLLRLGVLGFKS